MTGGKLNFTCAAGCEHEVVFDFDDGNATLEQCCEEITRQTGVPARLIETGRRNITEWRPSTMEQPITREKIDKAIRIDVLYHNALIGSPSIIVCDGESGERTEPDDDEVVCACGMFIEKTDADAVQCEECGAVVMMSNDNKRR